MKKGAEHWNEEYAQGNPHFRALSSQDPSIAAIKFISYLKDRGLPRSGNLLEVGCGQGRNSNWLASQGFSVTGVDISSQAISEAKARAGEDVNYSTVDVSVQIPVADQSQDYVLDFMMTHLLSSQELTSYTKNLLPTIKMGGAFVIYTLDRVADAQARKLLIDHPGPEPNTYILPGMGHLERTFTLEEITQLFSPLRQIHAELIMHPTRYKNKVYDRYYWWVVFQKE